MSTQAGEGWGSETAGWGLIFPGTGRRDQRVDRAVAFGRLWTLSGDRTWAAENSREGCGVEACV